MCVIWGGGIFKNYEPSLDHAHIAMKRKAHRACTTHASQRDFDTDRIANHHHVERSDAKNGERGGESGVCENDDDDDGPRGGG